MIQFRDFCLYLCQKINCYLLDFLNILFGKIFRKQEIIEGQFFIAGETLPDIPLLLLIHAVGQIHQIHEGFLYGSPILLTVVVLDDLLVPLVVIDTLGVGKQQLIHCHIYYNSTSLDCSRKFRNFWGSSFALRRLSDRLCLENGLSIVENPKPRSQSKYKHYGEWQKERKRPLNFQERLCLAIDSALAKRPASLEEFLGLMKQAGYEVKKVRGGGLSFRLPGGGQDRFTRLRASTLGEGYDLKDILAAIEGGAGRRGPERKISLAVDIQAKLAEGKGPGYERWAKVFNLKQMAAALAYLQDNGLTEYSQLEQKAEEASDRFHALSGQIKQTETALKANMELKAATVQYAKTRPVFDKYKASKYSRKFLAEHEADIELYRAAQADMRRLLGGAKLPKMEAQKEEGRKLVAKKKRLYGEYQKARRDMQEVLTIKANIDCLLGYSEPAKKKEMER